MDQHNLTQHNALEEAYHYWLEDGRLAIQGKVLFSQLDSFISNTLDETERLLNDNTADAANAANAAFSYLVMRTNFVNAVVQAYQNLIGRLANQISKYQTCLQNMANKLDAASFTISVGFPSGVSLSLTWKIEHTKGSI